MITNFDSQWNIELQRQRQIAMEFRYELTELKSKSLIGIILWWFKLKDRKTFKSQFAKFLQLNKK